MAIVDYTERNELVMRATSSDVAAREMLAICASERTAKSVAMLVGCLATANADKRAIEAYQTEESRYYLCTSERVIVQYLRNVAAQWAKSHGDDVVVAMLEGRRAIRAARCYSVACNIVGRCDELLYGDVQLLGSAHNLMQAWDATLNPRERDRAINCMLKTAYDAFTCAETLPF